MNPRATNLLKDLRAAIVRALSGSSEVRGLFDQIREEGYSLYFVVNRKVNRDGARQDLGNSCETETTPVFKIDGRDLSILRGLGIDPTRSTRRRRQQ
ncbi:MAG: hypothetical protein IH936_04480 [Acidobacteria bacterium]|nr:hypothetical protein [Acidobacteriota bacterium]